MVCDPLENLVAPFVVTVADVPLATAEPTSTPSAYSGTVAPATVPPMVNVSALAGLLLSSDVRLSVDETPVSLAITKSGAQGAAPGGADMSAASRFTMGEPMPVTKS